MVKANSSLACNLWLVMCSSSAFLWLYMELIRGTVYPSIEYHQRYIKVGWVSDCNGRSLYDIDADDDDGDD